MTAYTAWIGVASPIALDPIGGGEQKPDMETWTLPFFLLKRPSYDLQERNNPTHHRNLLLPPSASQLV